MAIQRTAMRTLAGLAFAAMAFTGGHGAALAQSGALSADELKPLYAMAADLAEGKDLAASTCAKCHGIDGLSVTKAVPHLAGQRPSYLYRELKEYQAGHRSNADMAQKVKFLSDDAIVKVSAYYASLDPAQPPATPAPAVIDPVAAGQQAAAPCAKCHGETGISQKAGVPSLVGLDVKYLVSAMKYYKDGDRKLDPKDASMTTALEPMSDKQLGYVALHYALQSNGLARAATPVEGNPAVSKESLARCVKCHDENGIGTSPATPSLAGQDSAYMIRALHSYKDESRDDDVMSPRAKKLNDDDMLNLAAYFASLTPKPTAATRPLSPEQWAEKCDHCHGAGGNSARANVPALAGQRLDYLEAVLGAYRSGERKSSEMAAMSGILSDDDIAGIAAHYAYQKARGAVFVPVPAK